MKKIIAIGAHPDDAEIGMGGTLAMLSEQGHEVTILDLTDGEPTPTGTHEKRIKESKVSADILKIKNRITLNLDNRELRDNIKARKMVAEIFRKLKPDIIFTPYWEDAHPDHEAASKLALASRFYSKFVKTDMSGEPHFPSKIYYYFASHLKLHIKPSFIIDTSDYQDIKIKAIKQYSSQFNKKRNNLFIFDRINTVNSYYGILIKTKYAEAFLSKEEIGLNSLDCLII